MTTAATDTVAASNVVDQSSGCLAPRRSMSLPAHVDTIAIDNMATVNPA